MSERFYELQDDAGRTIERRLAHNACTYVDQLVADGCVKNASGVASVYVSATGERVVVNTQGRKAKLWSEPAPTSAAEGPTQILSTLRPSALLKLALNNAVYSRNASDPEGTP